jgi:hypothetical protein
VEEGATYEATFCCAALLYGRGRLTEILELLPEDCRRRLQPYLTKASGWTVEELGKELRRLRQADARETTRRRTRASHVQWEALPARLERWLYSQAWECNGRKDY